MPRASEGDVVRVTRAADGRLAACFEKGPVRRGVCEHHGAGRVGICGSRHHPLSLIRSLHSILGVFRAPNAGLRTTIKRHRIEILATLC